MWGTTPLLNDTELEPNTPSVGSESAPCGDYPPPLPQLLYFTWYHHCRSAVEVVRQVGFLIINNALRSFNRD